MKKYVRFTKKVKDFIIDKMHEGMNVSEICRKYPEEVPDSKTIYKRSMTDEDFKKRMDDAYTILMMQYNDQLKDISRPEWVIENLHLFNDDPKIAFEARRAKMDDLKFTLGKLAPILSKRFDKASKIEIEGNNTGPQINILNYSTEDIKKVKDIEPIVAEEVKKLKDKVVLADKVIKDKGDEDE